MIKKNNVSRKDRIESKGSKISLSTPIKFHKSSRFSRIKKKFPENFQVFPGSKHWKFSFGCGNRQDFWRADEVHRLSPYRIYVTHGPKSATWKRGARARMTRRGRPGDDDAVRGRSHKHICSRRRQDLITGLLIARYAAAARSPPARADRPLSSTLRFRASRKFAILIDRERERERERERSMM